MDVKELIENVFNEHPELSSLSEKEKKLFLEKTEERLFPVGEISIPNIDSADPDSFFPKKAEYFDNLNQKYRKPTEKAFNDFTDYCIAQKIQPLKITSEQMTEFIKYCYEDGKSQNTTRVLFSRINQYYKYLVSEKIIGYDKNPCDKIIISDIEYNSSQRNSIPSFDEILKIMDSLPINLAAVVAATTKNFYSLEKLGECNFRNTHIDIDSYSYGLHYFYIDDFEPFESFDVEDGTISLIDFDPWLDYNTHVNDPAWYQQTMMKFSEYLKQTYPVYAEKKEWDENVFVKCNINLHSYENMIAKKTRELFNEGKISYPYRLRNFRLYGIAQFYNETKNIKEVQKELGHTNLNTTRRFLQSCGIKLIDEK